MKNEHPLLIVLSCTRNYGWCTRAFLEGNLKWADYIIIVDQMSTDGTREMCAEYGERVILVDDINMEYKEATRAKMAYERGKQIKGDKIFFALDIDEVLSANWQQTNDGEKVLYSRPGDMFSLSWAHISPDSRNCLVAEKQYRIYHDEPNRVFDISEAKEIHTQILPFDYTDWNATWEKIYHITDFVLLHFGRFFPDWNYYKRILYRMQYVKKHTYKSILDIYYIDATKRRIESAEPLEPIKKEWLYHDLDLFELVDRKSKPFLLTNIEELIKEDGVVKYSKLNIWDERLCKDLNVIDPQPIRYKLLWRYCCIFGLHRTWLIVRAMDKILRYLTKIK